MSIQSALSGATNQVIGGIATAQLRKQNEEKAKMKELEKASKEAPTKATPNKPTPGNDVKAQLSDDELLAQMGIKRPNLDNLKINYPGKGTIQTPVANDPLTAQLSLSRVENNQVEHQSRKQRFKRSQQVFLDRMARRKEMKSNE